MKNWKKKISLFLTSQAVSLFGSSLVQYAIIWHITLKTESGVMMTIATLCGFIPQIIISLFAGVWADYYNKKKLIMLADGLIAVTTLIIAVLFFFQIDSIWLLFVVLSVRSFGSGIQTPCTTALIPELIPEKEFMRINGINTTIQSIMLIASPALSGLLLANINLEYIFFIDVITAIIGISIMALLKYEFTKKEKVKIDYYASIKDGLSYIKASKLLIRMMIYLAIFNLLLTPMATLTPLLVTRTFGANPIYLTLNETIFFIGSVLGGLVISSWGGFKDRIKTIGLGCFLCGIFAFLMGLPFNFVFYLICIGLVGVTMPFMNTPFITLFQEKVEPEKHGRIFSIITIISGSIMPLGMLFYGPLADIVKIEYILIATGLLYGIASIYLLKDEVIKESLKKEIK